MLYKTLAAVAQICPNLRCFTQRTGCGLDLYHEPCHFSLNPHVMFKFQLEVGKSSVTPTSNRKTVFRALTKNFLTWILRTLEQWKDESVMWIRQVTYQWGQRREWLLLLAVMSCCRWRLLNMVLITPAQTSLFRKEVGVFVCWYRRLRVCGSLSPRHGASSGCGWTNGLRHWG